MRARDLYKPIECTTVEVNKDIENLANFAKKYNITYADLRRINPWLRDRKLITGGKTFKIEIPKEESMYYSSPNNYVHDKNWIVQ